MSLFRKKLAKFLENQPLNQVEETKEYGLSDLNWEDDGVALQDPSINDFNKGYQMEPYQFQQYAQKNILHKVESGDSLGSIAALNDTTLENIYKLNGFSKESILSSKHLKVNSYVVVGRCDCEDEKNVKEAAKEIIDITYTPENLAKEILTLWSQVDGPLQNFFDGFTMNKTDNKMKQQISDILNEWGYSVIPTYTQDYPIYAKAYSVFKKIASTENPEKIVNDLSKIFPNSKALNSFKSEVEGLIRENSLKVSLAEAGGLSDYYKEIFPDDYAMALVNVALDNPAIGFEDFKDISISDEALNQMEKMDSENQDPIGKPNDGGVGGYDYSSQTRPDGPSSGGVLPSSYEVGPYNVASVKKK